MLLLCVLDLVVRDAAKALHEEHHGRRPRATYFGRVVERAGWEAMADAAGFLDRGIAHLDELAVEREGLNPPDRLPRNVDLLLGRDAFAGRFRFAVHRCEDVGIE